MLALYISLGIIAFLFIAFFLVLFLIYHSTFYSPLKGQNDEYALSKTTRVNSKDEEVKFLINRIREIPYEEVYINSYDKKKLYAKIYRNNQSDTVCLMLHGYRGTARRDFSGGAYEMISKGYNVVLVDQRSHDKSSGHTITFGVREKYDVNSWLNYIKKEFGEDKRIVLIGISMGGATALLSCDLLTSKDKVIADCPYTSPKEIIYQRITAISKPFAGFLYFLTNLSLLIFGHTSLNKDRADEHVKKAKCPILIIHGSGDQLVPYQFSYRLKELFPDKITYVLFDGAVHGLCYINDTNKYNSAINDFLASK